MNLTPQQLRQAADAIEAYQQGKPIQVKRGDSEWMDLRGDGTSSLDVSLFLYRPKPEPRVRPWQSPADVPGPVCWVRNRALSGNATPVGSLITCIERQGVVLGSNQTLAEWDVFETLEYSTDRKAWFKCEVTEDAP